MEKLLRPTAIKKRPRKCNCNCDDCHCSSMKLKKSRSSFVPPPAREEEEETQQRSPLLFQEEEEDGCACGCGHCVVEDYVDIKEPEKKGIVDTSSGALELGKDKGAMFIMVEGMTCGGCVGMVTAALTRESGNIHYLYIL